MRSRRYRLALFGSIAAAIAIACGLDLAGELPDTFIDRRDGAPDVVDGGDRCQGQPCVMEISAGYSLTCAAMVSGPPRCWGANDAGQLGSGITSEGTPELSDSTRPRVVAMTERATRVSAGGFADGNDERPVVCALGESGSVWCWGDDSYGQSGRGDAGPSPPSVPARVVNLAGVREVHVGGSHVCAFIDGTSLQCWGRSHYGQNQKIGNPERTPSTVTTRAAIRSFATGNFHTCAILVDGTVDCWGYNTYGALGHPGTGGEIDASVVPNVANVQVVAAGHAHTCALHSEGKVTCWGYNAQGQLAREAGAPSAPPELVPLPNDASAIDVCTGFVHSCAVLADGTVACWGGNSWGQLGDGTDDAGDQSTPVVAEGVRGIVKISCGGGHTCALHGSGNVSCWGRNDQGQLGRGDAGAERHSKAAPIRF